MIFLYMVRQSRRGAARSGKAGHGVAVKASWATLCFGLFVHGRVWFGSRGVLRHGKLRRVELNFGAFGCVSAVKVMWVMSRLSGDWQGSRGIARRVLSASGALRFGLAVMARSVEHCRVQ